MATDECMHTHVQPENRMPPAGNSQWRHKEATAKFQKLRDHKIIEEPSLGPNTPNITNGTDTSVNYC